MARTKAPKKNGVKDLAATNNATPSSLPKTTESAASVAPATAPTPVAAQTTAAPATPATAPTAISGAEPRRLGIVKPDSRANIVPINLEAEIRALAYELSARRGFIPGHENEDWLAAEREVRQRYHQRSAKASA